MPTQKIMLPRVRRPRSQGVRLRRTSGNWHICMINRYPRSFRKMHAMTSSWTHADKKNVMRVAVSRRTRIAEIELWYTCRSRKP